MRSKAHESLFIRITCAAAHQRAKVLMAVCHLLYLVMSGPLYRMLQAKAFLRHLLPAAPAVFLLKSGHPAKPGACVSPERAYYRQASQEALKKNAACITCPAARKRAPFIQDYLSGNRKVVNFFPLRSMPEAKAFLLSPADLGVSFR